MNKIFLTSDLHFSHANIIKYAQRPFQDVEHMNESLIANWNAKVSQGDSVYVLGDFCFSPFPEPIFRRLAGQKFLIKGNHDRRETTLLPWGFVKDVYMLKYQSHEIWLSHYSHRVWPKGHRGVFHAFGHSHSKDGMIFHRSMDVGVDCQGYAPIDVDDFIKKLENNTLVEHHNED